MTDDRMCFCGNERARWWIGPFGDWCGDACKARMLAERPEATNIYPIDDHPPPMKPPPDGVFGGVTVIRMGPVQRRAAGCPS